jgi:hypothetical protein
MVLRVRRFDWCAFCGRTSWFYRFHKFQLWRANIDVVNQAMRSEPEP